MIHSIILHNRSVFARARALNLRVGREIFPVPSVGQLSEVIQSCLNGAACLLDIKDPQSLRLPELDSELVNQVLREYPDTIDVLGREVAVVYQVAQQPFIRLDFYGDSAGDWLRLPDGIYLPDGREVSVSAQVAGSGFSIVARSSQFKTQMRDSLNHQQWERWGKTEVLATPGPDSAVIEREYGRCVLTKEPLIAFGAAKYDTWYGSWKWYWTREREEAEAVNQSEQEKFRRLQEQKESETLRVRLALLYGEHHQNTKLSATLRDRLHKTHYQYSGFGGSDKELRQLIADVEGELRAGAEGTQQIQAPEKQVTSLAMLVEQYTKVHKRH